MTMDQRKQDKQPQQSDQRRMNEQRDRDMGTERNEKETGKPVELTKEGRQHPQHQDQGGQHQGGQHEGGQRKP